MIKYNIQKDSYEFDESSVGFFINVALQLTRRCNLKCIHCCEDGQMAEASIEQFKAVIDELAKEGCKKLCITGGEPLLRSDLVEILGYIHSKKMYSTLSTNGLILNKTKLTEMKPYINNIRFSLHGKEKIHDKFTRAKGSFKAVMQSIEVANKLRVPISAVASIIQLNFHEIIDIARICENKGVDKLYFFTLIARGRGAGIYNNQYISYEKVQRKFEELQDIAQKEHWKLKMNLIDWDREGQCVLLFPNGDLVGVPSFQDKENTKIIGNLFKDSGRSLWERYPFKKNYIAYYRNH